MTKFLSFFLSLAKKREREAPIDSVAFSLRDARRAGAAASLDPRQVFIIYVLIDDNNMKTPLRTSTRGETRGLTATRYIFQFFQRNKVTLCSARCTPNMTTKRSRRSSSPRATGWGPQRSRFSRGGGSGGSGGARSARHDDDDDGIQRRPPEMIVY